MFRSRLRKFVIMLLALPVSAQAQERNIYDACEGTMKHRASRCSEVIAQNRRQKFNGTVASAAMPAMAIVMLTKSL